MADFCVGEILINCFDRIFVEKEGRLQKVPFSLESVEDVTALANHILKMCGATLNPESYYWDGMLPDGSRIAVVMPPASVDGATIAIRKVNKQMMSFDDMV